MKQFPLLIFAAAVIIGCVSTPETVSITSTPTYDTPLEEWVVGHVRSNWSGINGREATVQAQHHKLKSF